MVTSHDRECLAERPAAEQALLDGFLVKPVTASMLAQAMDAGRQARQTDQAGQAEGPGATPAMPPASVQRLAGLNLLVVEDNPGNLQITHELLAHEGAIVALAGDGQQALSLLAQTRGRPGFDAVLMDVQMPVMDGISATRLIRRQLGLELPIIAMTAGTLDAEREACLQAGMTEHVGKPFDPDTLVAVLRRHCPAATAAMAPLAGAAASAVPGPPGIAPQVLADAGRAGIALAEALARMSGRVELFERTLAALHEQDRALAQSLAQGGPAAARGLHGFRGLAAMLGAEQLAQLAAEGEHSPGPDDDWRQRFLQRRQADLAALDQLCASLGADLAARRSLQAGLDERAPAPPAADLRHRLGDLIELLDGADLEALDLHAALRGQLPRDAVGPLDEALAVLDFNTALHLCRELRATLGGPR
jgi:CheY-like chemotaxis protein